MLSYGSLKNKMISKISMNYKQTSIPDVWIIEPKVFTDDRGYFMEAYNQTTFEKHIGPVRFIQDNESFSTQGVLRGLHYQLAPYSQAKLVRVIQGSVLDIAVDIRQGSPTYGQHVAVMLSAENKKQLFIPRGFAHGFQVLSEKAIFTYKIDNTYAPEYERSIRFDDPDLNVKWDMDYFHQAILSPKDLHAPWLKDAEINFDYTKKDDK